MDPAEKINYDLESTEIVSVIDELPLWSAPFGLKLLDNIKMISKGNVLDIGSGLGFPAIEIAMRLGDSCKVFGIEPWKEARERANEKIKLLGFLDQILENPTCHS